MTQFTMRFFFCYLLNFCFIFSVKSPKIDVLLPMKRNLVDFTELVRNLDFNVYPNDVINFIIEEFEHPSIFVEFFLNQKENSTLLIKGLVVFRYYIYYVRYETDKIGIEYSVIENIFSLLLDLIGNIVEVNGFVVQNIIYLINNFEFCFDKFFTLDIFKNFAEVDVNVVVSYVDILHNLCQKNKNMENHIGIVKDVLVFCLRNIFLNQDYDIKYSNCIIKFFDCVLENFGICLIDEVVVIEILERMNNINCSVSCTLRTDLINLSLSIFKTYYDYVDRLIPMVLFFVTNNRLHDDCELFITDDIRFWYNVSLFEHGRKMDKKLLAETYSQDTTLHYICENYVSVIYEMCVYFLSSLDNESDEREGIIECIVEMLTYIDNSDEYIMNSFVNMINSSCTEKLCSMVLLLRCLKSNEENLAFFKDNLTLILTYLGANTRLNIDIIRLLQNTVSTTEFNIDFVSIDVIHGILDSFSPVSIDVNLINEILVLIYFYLKNVNVSSETDLNHIVRYMSMVQDRDDLYNNGIMASNIFFAFGQICNYIGMKLLECFCDLVNEMTYSILSADTKCSNNDIKLSCFCIFYANVVSYGNFRLIMELLLVIVNNYHVVFEDAITAIISILIRRRYLSVQFLDQILNIITYNLDISQSPRNIDHISKLISIIHINNGLVTHSFSFVTRLCSLDYNTPNSLKAVSDILLTRLFDIFQYKELYLNYIYSCVSKLLYHKNELYLYDPYVYYSIIVYSFLAYGSLFISSDNDSDQKAVCTTFGEVLKDIGQEKYYNDDLFALIIKTLKLLQKNCNKLPLISILNKGRTFFDFYSRYRKHESAVEDVIDNIR